LTANNGLGYKDDALNQRTLSLNPTRHYRRKSKQEIRFGNLPIPQLQSASNSECAFDFLAVGERDGYVPI